MQKDNKKFAKKRAQIKRVYDLLGKYNQIVQVSLANVTSAQFKKIHAEIRNNGGHLLVLKNSLLKKAAEFRAGGPSAVKGEKLAWAQSIVTEEAQEEVMAFKNICKNQYGYIFTNESISDLKPRIENYTIEAPAKVGVEAQSDVIIPPGPSGMDPSQISFFHALQITTKIVKGQIEIQTQYQVCFEGKKCGQSQVQLLKSMNIKPFKYGMKVEQMYDSGAILDRETCSISTEDILSSFRSGVKNIVAVSLETGLVTEPSVPYSVINSFKSLAAIGLETKYSFDFLTKVMSSQGSGSGPAPVKAETKAKVVEAEPEEEEMDLGGGGGLFGDDDDY